MRAGRKRQLTPKQQAFIDEYIITRNAYRSALKAGYSPKMSACIGSDLVNHDGPCRDEILRRLQLISDRYQITAERVLGEVAKIAFANIDDIVDIQDDGTPIINFRKTDREARSSISELTSETYMDCASVTVDADGNEEPREVKKVKVKFYDKLNALTVLARHLNLLKEKETPDTDPEDNASKLRQFLRESAVADGEPA